MAGAGGPRTHEQSIFLAGDQCLGILNFSSIKSEVPDPGDIDFLTRAAIRIACAIDYLQAYEQIDRVQSLLAKEIDYLIEEMKLTKNSDSLVGKRFALPIPTNRSRDQTRRVEHESDC